MVIAAVEIFLINRELYLGRSQGPTTWNAIMRRVFHKRSDIKFEPQSTIFVVICWKAVKVAVCMFEETSAHFNDGEATVPARSSSPCFYNPC